MIRKTKREYYKFFVCNEERWSPDTSTTHQKDTGGLTSDDSLSRNENLYSG